jgi:hypothetical protein
MSRKKIITLLIAAIVLVGGFFIVRQYLETQAHNAYLKSSDYVADELLTYLKAGDYKTAYSAIFSDRMKTNYTVDYWKDQVFPLVKDQAATRVSKKPANDINPNLPSPYTKDVDAQQYVYSYQVDGHAYRVTFVVINLDGTWYVNELEGAYQK